MDNNLSNKNISICDECDSQYYLNTSQMANLCPNCTHILYGYDNCAHQFKNDRCMKCFWNGNESCFIKTQK